MSYLRQIDELIAKGAPEGAVYDAIQAAITDYGGRLQQIWNDIEPEDYGIMLAVMESTAAGIRAMLKRIEARSGVENVHPHRFRRTLATNLINHGMPIQEVAAVLGHDKIDTTMRYVYIDQRNVETAYRKYA